MATPPRPLSSKKRLQCQSIEPLAEHLASLRAEEKEALAVLKEKLREQSQKLQKLCIEQETTPVSSDGPVPAPPVPPGIGSTAREAGDLLIGPPTAYKKELPSGRR